MGDYNYDNRGQQSPYADAYQQQAQAQQQYQQYPQYTQQQYQQYQQQQYAAQQYQQQLAAQQYAQYQQQLAAQQYRQAGSVGYSSNPYKKVSQRICGSGGFLVLAITFTLTTLLDLVLRLDNGNTLFTVLFSIADIFGISPYELMDVYDVIRDVNIVWGIVITIPAILITIGLWVAFASGKKRGENTSGAGAGLIKAGAIIKLIYVILMSAFILVLLVLAMDAVGSGDALAGIIVLTIFTIALIVLTIIYFAKAVKASSALKAAAAGKDAPFASKYFIVFTYFVVIGRVVLAILTAAAQSGYMRDDDVTMYIISAILGCTSLIMFSIRASAYNKLASEGKLEVARAYNAAYGNYQ